MVASRSEPVEPEVPPVAPVDTVWARKLAVYVAARFAGHLDHPPTPKEWAEVVEGAKASLVPVGASDDPAARGRARKVSVSMPEELTAAVQLRVGKGEFSHYVAEAVARQLEVDLLDELAALLEEEHGPVPAALLAEAEAAWPDAG